MLLVYYQGFFARCGALLGTRLGEVLSPRPKPMPLVSLVLLQV
jgi:hypothetical protein